MGTDVEVTFSNLRSITTTRYFNAICSVRWALRVVYSINCLFKMLHSEMFFQKYSQIHFTMGTNFEVTIWHLRSIPTKVDVFAKVAVHEEYYQKPIGSTYHDLSLKLYLVFSFGKGGMWPGMPDWEGYVTAILRTQQRNIIKGWNQRHFCRARQAE